MSTTETLELSALESSPNIVLSFSGLRIVVVETIVTRYIQQ